LADLTQLQTWLSEAEVARHALAMGQSVVEVWRDGRRVTYGKSNLADLTEYVRFLEAEIARKTSELDENPRRRPINLTWMN